MNELSVVEGRVERQVPEIGNSNKNREKISVCLNDQDNSQKNTQKIKKSRI